MLKRLRAAYRTAARSLSDEQGSTLPEVMVSVIVSAVTMSVVAGAVVAVGALTTEMVNTGVVASESAYTDLRWSNDVRAAVAIEATDGTQAKLTIPGTAGKCSTTEWLTGAGGLGLIVKTVAYPTMSVNACTGPPATPTSEELVASSTELAFLYKNPGGRVITFASGNPTLAAANKPGSVSYDAWESLTIGVATLRTTAAAGTGWERPIISTRAASTILGSGAGAVTAGTADVLGGDLIASNYLIETTAGSGVAGWADAAAASAQFNGATGIASDVAGNLYVADRDNHRIRKISTTGNVTTVAGSGAAGYRDDVGVAALFWAPEDVAIDAAGNTFVADAGNHVIRKISPDGIVTTLAGKPGIAGFANGAGSAASFNGPASLVIAASGDIYVAERIGNRIRKVTPAGVVTTVSGDGGTTLYNAPRGIAISAAGDLYVADTGNHRILMVTTAGVRSHIAGSTRRIAGFLDGGATSSRFSSPTGVAIDADGNIFVTDSGNKAIRQVTAYGTVVTVAGGAASGSSNGTTQSATFSAPVDVTLVPGDRLAIIDRSAHKVRSLR